MKHRPLLFLFVFEGFRDAFFLQSTWARQPSSCLRSSMELGLWIWNNAWQDGQRIWISVVLNCWLTIYRQISTEFHRCRSTQIESNMLLNASSLNIIVELFLVASSDDSGGCWQELPETPMTLGSESGFQPIGYCTLDTLVGSHTDALGITMHQSKRPNINQLEIPIPSASQVHPSFPGQLQPVIAEGYFPPTGTVLR